MQCAHTKTIGIYDVPPSAVVGLMAISDRDRVIVEFVSFDDIGAGHISIPYRRRDLALAADRRVPVVPARLAAASPQEMEGWSQRLDGAPIFSPGGKMDQLRSQLSRHICLGLPIEYETGALNFSVADHFRSAYATTINGGLRARDLLEAAPGQWVTFRPCYDAGRAFFVKDVNELRLRHRTGIAKAIAHRAESLGVASGWLNEAREHITSLVSVTQTISLADDLVNGRPDPRRSPRG